MPDLSGYAPAGYYDPVTLPNGDVVDYDDPRPHGTITLSFEPAPAQPYGSFGPPTLRPLAATGGEQLSMLFDTAAKRIHRRRRERERAMLPRRPRHRTWSGPLADDAPTPRGFHRRGECPECPSA